MPLTVQWHETGREHSVQAHAKPSECTCLLANLQSRGGSYSVTSYSHCKAHEFRAPHRAASKNSIPITGPGTGMFPTKEIVSPRH